MTALTLEAVIKWEDFAISTRAMTDKRLINEKKIN